MVTPPTLKCKTQFLSHVSKWFTSDKFVLNLDKTNKIKFITNKSPQPALKISYGEK